MPLSVPEIDEKIRGLKTQRNTIAAPLCRVPPELFIDILQDDDIDGWDVLAVYASCTILRNRLARIPAIWSDIPDSPRREVLDHFLSRSGTGLLSCHFNSDVDQSYTFESVKKYLLRFRYLGVDSGTHISELVESLHTQQAPYLESLTQIAGPDSCDAYSYPYPRPQVRSNLLGGICTRLASLSLSHFVLEGLPHMPCLAVMNLSHCEAELDVIYSTLQAFRTLEHLKLKHALKKGTPSPEGLNPITLPALQSLTVQNDMTGVVAVLAILSDPSLYMSIKIDEEWDWSTTSGPNAEVLNRLRGFWDAVSDGEDFPPMSLCVTCVAKGPSRSTQILEMGEERTNPQSDWETQGFYYSALCVIWEEDPMLDNVKTVIIRPIAGTEATWEMQGYEWFEIDNYVDIKLLTAVEDLTIEYSSNIININTLESDHWLRRTADLRVVHSWLKDLKQRPQSRVSDMNIVLRGGGFVMKCFERRLRADGLAGYNLTFEDVSDCKP